METESLFNVNRSLFEQLCTEANLHAAFLEVKRNKGAAGIDGQTIEDFEAELTTELSRLSKELATWKYRCKPVKRVEIPKADGKGVRKLGIPCVRDRVVGTCLKQLLEPLFEPHFSESSYGFRPGRSQRAAVEAAQKHVQGGKEWVVDIDLAQFFDTIHHDRLINRLGERVSDKRILRLIGNSLRSGAILPDGSFEPSPRGSVQGSPLSPLLSNIVLDELDKELEKRDLSFVRWADDSNIFVRSEKAAHRVLETVSRFIRKRLRLEVNEEKSQAARSEHVKFLGMTIIDGTRAISRKSLKRAMETVKELTPTNSPVPVQKTLERVNQWYKGWAQYHSMTEYPNQLQVVEAHVRRRLRARIARQCKRPRTLYKKMLARGARSSTARRNAFSGRGPWWMSLGPMNHSWPVKWFTETMGQVIHSDRKLPGWKSVHERILLP